MWSVLCLACCRRNIRWQQVFLSFCCFCCVCCCRHVFYVGVGMFSAYNRATTTTRQQLFAPQNLRNSWGRQCSRHHHWRIHSTTTNKSLTDRMSSTPSTTPPSEQLEVFDSLLQATYHPPGTDPPPCKVEWMRNPDGTVLKDHYGDPLSVARILATKPLRHELSTRPGPGGRKLTYISGDEVTRTLNDVFGYQGWNLDIKSTNREVSFHRQRIKAERVLFVMCMVLCVCRDGMMNTI